MQSNGIERIKLTMFLLCQVFLFGCTPPANELIDRVNMEVSPNLETVTLTVNFTRRIQPDLLGSFAIGSYGNLFLNPSTETSPFQIGFRLDTAIVNDQNLLRLAPVTTLPNGVNLPMSLSAALVQLNLPHPVNPQFDLFAYVDVFQKKWLGSAVVLQLIDGEFPAGLAMSQGYFKNAQGYPSVYVTAFGPRVENDQVKVYGGVAIFGNIQRMIAIHQTYKAKGYQSYTTQAMKAQTQDTIPLY